MSLYSDQVVSVCCNSKIYLKLYVDDFDSNLEPVNIDETMVVCSSCELECDHKKKELIKDEKG